MESLPLPIADIIVILFILWGAWLGYKKGFVITAASTIALIAGGLAAFYCSDYVADFLNSNFNWEEGLIKVSAFAITFILVVIGIHMLGKALEKVVDMVALGSVNKIAGILLGVFQIALLLSFVISRLHEVDILPRKVDKDCVVYPYVEDLAYTVMPFYDGFDKKRLNKRKRKKNMDDLKEKGEEFLNKASDKIDSTKNRKRRK
tara:strand:- start:478 stop:1089 length:612 start_codon:yes stop_codon:yes gene_type:complete